MTGNEAISTLIRARLQARREREFKQRQLLPADQDHHETIRMKLEGLFDGTQYWNYCRCGNEQIYRTCKSCGEVQQFPYRCSLKWCPRCQWWITERRKKILQLWAGRITQPKHLVLTQRNFQTLTGRKIREHTKALAKMRRSKCFQAVKGGCVTVEITNEGNGWHLHSHWLIDVRWLDMEAVSRKWGRLVGQEFSIVKIKDVRNTDYLREVSKYVVEGSEMATWAPEHINEFVRAVRGRRFFFPFGSLFHMGPAIRAELRSGQEAPRECDCGCSDFTFEDQTQVIVNEAKALLKQGHEKAYRTLNRSSDRKPDRPSTAPRGDEQAPLLPPNVA